MKIYFLSKIPKLKLAQEAELFLIMFLACCWSYTQFKILPIYWFIITFFCVVFAPFILGYSYFILETCLLNFFKFLNFLSRGSGQLLTIFYKKGREQFVEKHDNLLTNIINLNS
jgi:hypothetical protein